MKNFDISFPAVREVLRMIYVRGTHGSPYLFGERDLQQEIDVPDFFISKFTVTQKLLDYVMGYEYTEKIVGGMPAVRDSHNSLVGPFGFFETFNNLLKEQGFSLDSVGEFRLPTETEWEYAARGGVHWIDNFEYSGSNDMDAVAWYLNNSDRIAHPAGQKKPNQLSIHDLCGNVWEWCADHFVRDTNLIPKDGSPVQAESNDRVLRGGCNHNGAIHCRVDKRYETPADAEDENIGFRIVVAA